MYKEKIQEKRDQNVLSGMTLQTSSGQEELFPVLELDSNS